MFNPENQRIDNITYDPEAIELLKSLMGPQVDPRKDFIFTNVDFSTISE